MKASYERIFELHLKGVSDKAIAERMGVSRAHVINVLTAKRKAAGLPPRRRGPKETQ